MVLYWLTVWLSCLSALSSGLVGVFYPPAILNGFKLFKGPSTIDVLRLQAVGMFAIAFYHFNARRATGSQARAHAGASLLHSILALALLFVFRHEKTVEARFLTINFAVIGTFLALWALVWLFDAVPTREASKKDD